MRAFVWTALVLFTLQLLGSCMYFRAGCARPPLSRFQLMTQRLIRSAMGCWAIALLMQPSASQIEGISVSPICRPNGMSLLTRVDEVSVPRVTGTRMDLTHAEGVNGPASRHGAGHLAGGRQC